MASPFHARIFYQTFRAVELAMDLDRDHPSQIDLRYNQLAHFVS